MGIDAKIIRTGRGSSAAKAKLRRAYREKAFETHPDKKLPNVRPRLLSTMHVQQTMERTFVTFLETKAQKDLRSHGPIVLFTHLHEVPEAVGDRQEGLD